MPEEPREYSAMWGLPYPAQVLGYLTLSIMRNKRGVLALVDILVHTSACSVATLGPQESK